MAIPTSGSVLGQVAALAIRPVRKAPPCSVQSVEAISGKGLANDSHADALSPRQVLIASSQAYADLDLPAHSLRENLLVDCDTSALVSGTVLQIGERVRLWLTFQCEACGHLNVHNKSLSRDIGNRRGVLARVLEGGLIRAGDHVRVLGQFLPEWSDDWRLRIARVLNAVPQNAVIEYRQLARLAGVPSSYCRVFPRFIRTLGPAAVRKAIPGTAKSSKPRWQGESIFDVQPDEEQAAENMTTINQTIRTTAMANVSPSELRSEIARSLRESSTKSSTVVQLGQSKVLFTSHRTLKTASSSDAEPKPYPKTECTLPDEYDSWLS